MKTRIQFLDNLRTFMILLVVILHSGMVYMGGFESFWLVNDPDQINSLGLINMYIDIFVMFTIFFVSGYLIPISLNRKSTRGFLISKFKRIMLPWALAVFTLIPAYKAIFLYSHGLPQEAWYAYFHLFSRAGDNPYFFADSPTQSWLWFLPVLFTFQVIYLVLAKLNLLRFRISMTTAIITTIIVGTAYSMLISSLGLTGWYKSYVFDFQRERLLSYFLVFLLGSLAYKHMAFMSEVKNKRMYLTSNVVLTVVLGIFTAVALNLFFNIIEPGRDYYFISPVIDKTAYYLTSMLSMMSLLYVLLHTFRFSFNKSNRVMDQLNRSSYQVYIIHMIVLGVFALALSQTSLPGIVKYIIVVVLTYGVSNLLVVVYNQVLQNRMALKLSGAAAFLIVLMAVTQYGNAGTRLSQNDQLQVTQDVTPPEKGLHAAIISGDMEAVKQHILAGSDLNIPEPSGGSSPLITAATFNNTEAARLLIEAGADIDYQNRDGSTALHTAAFFCRSDIVKMLIDNGADKNLKNNQGSIPVELVIMPFEMVRGVYEYFQNILGPLGLKLDLQRIKRTRPEIADMLSK